MRLSWHSHLFIKPMILEQVVMIEFALIIELRARICYDVSYTANA